MDRVGDKNNVSGHRDECENEWERERNDFSVVVGVHQDLVLGPLLFVIILVALSRKIREGLYTILYYNSLFKCIMVFQVYSG